MTVHVVPSPNGYACRGFTVAEFERMGELGIIGDDEHLELIEGELVEVAAKNHVHETVKSDLNLAIARVLPNHLRLAIETSLRLGPTTLLEPDLCIYPKGLVLEDVRGPDVLLAIEVADTSLRYDRTRKAPAYARHGVRELWIVEANTRTTYVHRHPSPSGWAFADEVAADSLLAAEGLDLGSIRFRLIDLG